MDIGGRVEWTRPSRRDLARFRVLNCMCVQWNSVSRAGESPICTCSMHMCKHYVHALRIMNKYTASIDVYVRGVVCLKQWPGLAKSVWTLRSSFWKKWIKYQVHPPTAYTGWFKNCCQQKILKSAFIFLRHSYFHAFF